MGTNFTDITTAFRFRASELNVPLGELDDAIEDVRSSAEGAASAVATFGSMATKDFWSGTQTQYNALGTYDSDTLYFIVEG